MITANNIIKLSEEWTKSGRAWGRNLDVYVNPTSSDYLKMNKDARNNIDFFGKPTPRDLKEIRFIADPRTQKVYVSDAEWSNHPDICKIVGLPYFGDGCVFPCIQGMASIVNGKAKMIDRSFGTPVGLRNKEDFSKFNWSFVDRIIDGFSPATNLYFR